MKLIMKNVVFAFLAAGIMYSCGDEPKESSIETPEIEFEKEGELDLIKEGNVVKSIDIEIADSPYEWETGLMYRESLGEDQGMLFVYSNAAPRSFYMKNTYIPLDLIFYDSNRIVVNIHENAVPLDETSIPSGAPAQYILEVNAGKAEDWNVEIGDEMNFSQN